VEVTLTDRNGEPVQAETSETQKGAPPEAEQPKQAKKTPWKQRLKERLKAAEAKAEDNYQRLLRATAEFENYKKRGEREMNDTRKFANESLIKEILPIVDNLERALATPYEQNEEAFNAIRKGVEMTLKGLLDSLNTFGVVAIEALEKPFDPHFHQGVSQMESDQHPENTVLHELQKGYMLRDRLLRPAMVVVSKGSDTKVEVKSEDPEDQHKTLQGGKQ
jgi:molecular chaperone GrpE